MKNNHFTFYLGLLLLAALLAACAQPQPNVSLPPTVSGETPGAAIQSASPTPQDDRPTRTTPAVSSTPEASSTPQTGGASSTPLATPDATTATLAPTPRTPPPTDAWKTLPIVPTASDTARAIFQRGQALGRDPHAFSKIGDCQSIPSYFLSLFEYPNTFTLGPDYEFLQKTIDWYAGSFKRTSVATKGGFNAASMLSPLRADPELCEKGENPLECELRLNNPSIALISLEEWWVKEPTDYEKYLRQIIEYTISQGIVPIVGTKADNMEGDYAINATISRLAWEYDIPLWNFWAAVQPLPSQGLQPDGFHLTLGHTYDFGSATSLEAGWAVRNLTALQALDAVRHGLGVK